MSNDNNTSNNSKLSTYCSIVFWTINIINIIEAIALICAISELNRDIAYTNKLIDIRKKKRTRERFNYDSLEENKKLRIVYSINLFVCFLLPFTLVFYFLYNWESPTPLAIANGFIGMITDYRKAIMYFFLGISMFNLNNILTYYYEIKYCNDLLYSRKKHSQSELVAHFVKARHECIVSGIYLVINLSIVLSVFIWT